MTFSSFIRCWDVEFRNVSILVKEYSIALSWQASSLMRPCPPAPSGTLLSGHLEETITDPPTRPLVHGNVVHLKFLLCSSGARILVTQRRMELIETQLGPIARGCSCNWATLARTTPDERTHSTQYSVPEHAARIWEHARFRGTGGEQEDRGGRR